DLPLQLTSFVGREAALAEVKALLSRARLVTLTGVGGAGKTRLALRVAADLLPEYADGARLAELGPLADAALVPQAVVKAAGVSQPPGRDAVAALADALRPSRLLLVLDNCEHLVAACAALAAGLLESCPHLRLLATSREPLRVPGAVPGPVPS